MVGRCINRRAALAQRTIMPLKNYIIQKINEISLKLLGDLDNYSQPCVSLFYTRARAYLGLSNNIHMIAVFSNNIE